MDCVDFLYVRARSEELLARIRESETIAVTNCGMAAPRSTDSVQARRYGLVQRLRKRWRRRALRVLPEPTPQAEFVEENSR